MTKAYRTVRPLIFRLTPEQAHAGTIALLRLGGSLGVGRWLLRLWFRPRVQGPAVQAFGLTFPNPLGMAAGYDKDGLGWRGLACLGFGHIEVGTVTPKAQPGNPLPRIFRLVEQEAVINRMGFPNRGAEFLAARLRGPRSRGLVLGVNIGKNKATPNEQAIDDYVECFEALHPVVDYFVVNVSSPNTPGLRALQEKAPLLGILNELKRRDAQKDEHRPILLKIAPDLTPEQLDDIVAVVLESGIAGVIATNTTIAREGLRTPKSEVDAIGAGGLSGAPVRQRSTEVVRYLRQRMPPPIVIIGVGGIDSAESALEKLDAGADLVQVFSGLVYEGPALLKRINEAFVQWRSRK